MGPNRLVPLPALPVSVGDPHEGRVHANGPLTSASPGDQVDQEVATHSIAIADLLSLLVLMEPTIKVMEIVALMAARSMDAVVLKKNAKCHSKITS